MAEPCGTRNCEDLIDLAFRLTKSGGYADGTFVPAYRYTTLPAFRSRTLLNIQIDDSVCIVQRYEALNFNPAQRESLMVRVHTNRPLRISTGSVLLINSIALQLNLRAHPTTHSSFARSLNRSRTHTRARTHDRGTSTRIARGTIQSQHRRLPSITTLVSGALDRPNDNLISIQRRRLADDNRASGRYKPIAPSPTCNTCTCRRSHEN